MDQGLRWVAYPFPSNYILVPFPVPCSVSWDIIFGTLQSWRSVDPDAWCKHALGKQRMGLIFTCVIMGSMRTICCDYVICYDIQRLISKCFAHNKTSLNDKTRIDASVVCYFQEELVSPSMELEMCLTTLTLTCTDLASCFTTASSQQSTTMTQLH